MKTEITKETQLESYAQQVASLHNRAKDCAAMTILLALRCGYVCYCAKELLPHGQFEEWAKRQQLPFSEKTRRNYMRVFSEAKKIEIDLIKDIEQKKFEEAITDPEHLTKLIQKIQETFQGSTIAELYREWGITKQNKLADHGTNNPEGANGWDTRKDKQEPEQLELFSRLEWFGDAEPGMVKDGSLMGKLMQSIEPDLKKPSWIHLTKTEKQSLVEHLGDLRNKIKETL